MKEKSNRPPLATRTWRLVNPGVLDTMMKALPHLPIDPLRPLEIVVREHQPKRGQSQNALYWALLNEIAAVPWGGYQYSAETLHEYMKRELLPEDEPKPDPAEVREGYVKWAYDPAGVRVLVGSTTMLTVKGFANMINGVEAFGASLGVQFKARGEA